MCFIQEEKISMRLLLNMGKAEVELQQGSQDNPSNLKPLARFLVGGLWISYRMTHTGESHICISDQWTGSDARCTDVRV